MADQLNVEVREQLGTTATRRLRQAGKVPAVLYGHGGENLHLSVPEKDVALLLRHHSKHVELQGVASEHALIKDVQWDPLGMEVLHLDLLRISMDERVTMSVPVKLHGSPVGLNHHGAVNEILHDVEISVPAVAIPDELVLNVNDLDVGQSKTAGDIPLPAGAELLTDPTSVIVMVSEISDGGDEETEQSASAEPEVIGEKKQEEE